MKSLKGDLVVKKNIIAILVLSFLLCSCGTKTEGKFTSGQDPDVIAKFEYANSEQDAPNEEDRFLIPFEFNKPFKSVKLWIELYDHGELVDKIEMPSGATMNTPKATNGFLGMWFDTYGDMIPELQFITYMGNDNESISSQERIDVDELWYGKELQVFMTEHQPEGDEVIISGEEHVISSIGFRDAEDTEKPAIPEDDDGSSNVAMVYTPYMLLLKCEFEF